MVKQKNIIDRIAQEEEFWLFVERNKKRMFEYLLNGKLQDDTHPEEALRMMIRCLGLVVRELYLRTEKRQKYPPQVYSEEDFIDMVINTIAQRSPFVNDTQEMIDYIEEYRSILWGYAHYHGKDYFDLYSNFDKYYQDDSTLVRLRESMVIVVVECLLRNIEKKMK